MHAIQVILERISQTRFWGMSIFVLIAVALTFSSVLLVNYSRFTETNLVSIEKQPLTTPILLCVILISLFLALTISLNVSREYANSTIEMLFYGPVDEISYMLGNFFAQIKIFLLSLIAIVIWLNLSTWLLNLDFRLDIFAMLLAAVFMCGQLVAFGLLMAAWGGKTRNTMVYFLLIILLIGGIQVADLVTSTLVIVQQTTVNDPLVVVRNVLSSLSEIIAWISPYSHLNKAFDAVLNSDMRTYLGTLGLMLIEMSMMLAGSILLLKKKGVRG